MVDLFELALLKVAQPVNSNDETFKAFQLVNDAGDIKSGVNRCGGDRSIL